MSTTLGLNLASSMSIIKPLVVLGIAYAASTGIQQATATTTGNGNATHMPMEDDFATPLLADNASTCAIYHPSITSYRTTSMLIHAEQDAFLAATGGSPALSPSAYRRSSEHRSPKASSLGYPDYRMPRSPPKEGEEAHWMTTDVGFSVNVTAPSPTFGPIAMGATRDDSASIIETIRFAAYLNQPKNATVEEKDAHVDYIVDLLELEPYLENAPGFSSSLNRRLSVAVKLAAQPTSSLPANRSGKWRALGLSEEETSVSAPISTSVSLSGLGLGVAPSTSRRTSQHLRVASNMSIASASSIFNALNRIVAPPNSPLPSSMRLASLASRRSVSVDIQSRSSSAAMALPAPALDMDALSKALSPMLTLTIDAAPETEAVMMPTKSSKFKKMQQKITRPWKLRQLKKEAEKSCAANGTSAQISNSGLKGLNIKGVFGPSKLRAL